MAASATAFAQSQYCFMDMEALGFDGSADIPAGTVLVQSEYGVVTNMFDEALKSFNPSRDPYNHVLVAGGEAIQITNGVTGANNPKGQGMNKLPESGMVYQLTTTKTGYFTVLTKMNSNKNYWLFEGSSFAAYRLGDCNLSKAEGAVIEYTMPVDEYDMLDLASPEIGKYFTLNDNGEPTGPKVPWSVYDAEGQDMGDGSGFIQFISYASEDAPITFTYFAQGSKMANNGFIFTPADAPTFADAPAVVFSGVEKEVDGVVTPAPTPIAFGEVAGIQNVAVDQNVVDFNAPVYNIYGQRVSRDTKGLLIQNGVKYYNR